MLRRNDRARARRYNRQYERLSLERQAPNERIPPHRYTRPYTVPLGFTTQPPTEYDISRSTIPLRHPSSSSSSNNSTDSNETSSVSVYTVRLYNRLEGRWENPRPLPFPELPEYRRYQEEEAARLLAEPHPIHNDYHRSFYVEYHRLRYYNNSTDSSYNNNNGNTSSDTTDIDDSTTKSTDTDTHSFSSKLTEESNKLLYWPDHDYNEGPTIEFEIDSDGEFPLSEYSISTAPSIQHFHNTPVGYATQDEEYVYQPPRLDPFDDSIDPVTGRYNSAYWHHLHHGTGNHPGRERPYIPQNKPRPTSPPSPPLPAAVTYTTTRHSDTTTRLPETVTSITATTTERVTALPTLGNRRDLPLLAARKSVARKSVDPARLQLVHFPHGNTYAHLMTYKRTARKSTIIQKEETITQKVASLPTPTPVRRSKRINKKRKHTTGTPSSSSDSSGIPYMPRFKKDPNE